MTSWSEFLRNLPSDQDFLIAHPGGESLEQSAAGGTQIDRPIIAAIGPEGGFTDEEVQLAVAAGARTIRLGPQILRIETAAIAIAAKLLL